MAYQAAAPQEKDQEVQAKGQVAQEKAQVGQEAVMAVALAASADLEAVPQEATVGRSAAAALVVDQAAAAAASDQVVQEVQADQFIQECLEAQVGQMVSEDQVADHHPLLRLTADPQQQQLTGHRATPP